jgi:hypothetical protein
MEQPSVPAWISPQYWRGSGSTRLCFKAPERRRSNHQQQAGRDACSGTRSQYCTNLNNSPHVQQLPPARPACYTRASLQGCTACCGPWHLPSRIDRASVPQHRWQPTLVDRGTNYSCSAVERAPSAPPEYHRNTAPDVLAVPVLKRNDGLMVTQYQRQYQQAVPTGQYQRSNSTRVEYAQQPQQP